MCNSGALPPVHELFKRPSYYHEIYMGNISVEADKSKDF
jgi:hypothetical protein